jgi:hypothetical protein
MLPTTRSAALFLERRGIIPTQRHQVPSMDPAASAVHTYPLARPLPDPRLLGATQGSPPPDRGQTEVWPHGNQDGA